MGAGEAAGAGDIGTPARPFFLGGGTIALRRGGRWYAQRCRHEDVPRETGLALAPGDWEHLERPTLRVPVWTQDAAAFAPVGDEILEEQYDRQAALRRRLGAWPPEWGR